MKGKGKGEFARKEELGISLCELRNIKLTSPSSDKLLSLCHGNCENIVELNPC